MKSNSAKRRRLTVVGACLGAVPGPILLASCAAQNAPPRNSDIAGPIDPVKPNIQNARSQARDACAADVARLCPTVRPDGNQREALRCLRQNRTAVGGACKSAIAALRGGRRDGARRGNAKRAAGSVSGTELAYGSDALQNLRFSPANCATGRAPVVVYVHGGAWTVGDKDRAAGGKARFYNDAGYHFVTVNYRLRPDATVTESAQDVASAIAFLQQRFSEGGASARRDIDAGSIILQGHSSGAHLAALVTLDQRYLAATGVAQSDIKAVSLLDGAGYDIGKQVAIGGNADLYQEVFGTDEAGWQAMSPITYATDMNERAAFVLHYVEGREAARVQAIDLADSISQGGGTATVYPAADRTHSSLNRMFGSADDTVSRETLDFIKSYATPCLLD